MLYGRYTDMMTRLATKRETLAALPHHPACIDWTDGGPFPETSDALTTTEEPPAPAHGYRTTPGARAGGSSFAGIRVHLIRSDEEAC